jgi:transcriptional regulator with XRE-family HTH domain
MGQLSREKLEFAIACFAKIYARRGISQTDLEELSGVKQPTISRILSHAKGEEEAYSPTEDVLAKLFRGLGHNLFDIVNEAGCLPEKIVGYLATPLTALTPTEHAVLKRVVNDIKDIAADERFASLPLEIYWPGDHTHPVEHPNLSAMQVYLTDRSRASTHNFIVLFCGKSSFGVGQENEIASQAGIPAIRLIPEKGISRMMAGSFVRAIDVKYEGAIDTGVRIPRNAMLDALQETKIVCVRHRAFYHGVSNEAFGIRLKQLIVDRCGGAYVACADDLGITLEYLHILMKEPLSVSNPGAVLLERIAKRLWTHIGFLLGESEVNDPVFVESTASWRKWADSSNGFDLATGLQIRDKWCDDYYAKMRSRGEASAIASFRDRPQVMDVKDWDALYQSVMKAKGGAGSVQRRMF